MIKRMFLTREAALLLERDPSLEGGRRFGDPERRRLARQPREHGRDELGVALSGGPLQELDLTADIGALALFEQLGAGLRRRGRPVRPPGRNSPP